MNIKFCIQKHLVDCYYEYLVLSWEKSNREKTAKSIIPFLLAWIVECHINLDVTAQ